MATMRITFQQLIQDSQDYGGDDDHMVSRAFFAIAVDGNNVGDHHADIKQTVGSDIESTPLEISNPPEYHGPFSYEAFRQAVENYYRSLVGTTGRGIRIGAGVTGLRMRNNTFVKTSSVEFEVSDQGSIW